MKILLIVGISVLALFILSIIIAYIVFRLTFYSNRRKKVDPFYGTYGEMTVLKKKSRDYIEKILSVPYEDVEIKSFDGLKLRAKYYFVKEGAPLQIQFHGYRSISTHDFAGGALECIRMGHNLLLVDQRAHGESEGRVISFGMKERYDVLSWTEYAVKRFGEETEILLYGISMGGATVLMASNLPLPLSVRGILADAPYSSVEGIIKKVMRDRNISALLFYPFVKLAARLFGSFGISDASPLLSVKETQIPILIIHGEGDDFVPCDMSREIAAAAPTAELRTFPEAGHGLSFIYDYEGYVSLVESFHNKVLKQERT